MHKIDKSPSLSRFCGIVWLCLLAVIYCHGGGIKTVPFCRDVSAERRVDFAKMNLCCSLIIGCKRARAAQSSPNSKCLGALSSPPLRLLLSHDKSQS